MYASMVFMAKSTTYSRIDTLTDRQKEVWYYLLGYHSDNLTAPTLKEIGARLGVSDVMAFKHVRALKRKGFVLVDEREHRGIVILDPEGNALTK